MGRHIAIVEDDAELRDNYAEALQRAGYKVSAYTNRSEAEAAFAVKLPDLAILDIMLEDERDGGFSLCRFLRARSNILPIIFLTALGSDIERVSGMHLGATDYLLKDTTTLDFLPVRVSSLFRFLDAVSKPIENESKLICGSLVVYLDRMETRWDGKPVHLTQTEFLIVRAMAKRPGQLKSHADLMTTANTIVSNNTIAATIGRIRGKFREVDPDFSCIQTAYGMGYRWVK